MNSYVAAAEVGLSQHGIIGLAQLREVGFNDQAVYRLVGAGKLVRVERATYRFPAVSASWRQDVMTAVVCAGEGALASHATAAVLHGLLDYPLDSVEIVMERWRRSQLGFIVHESLDLAEQDRDTVEGIPVTTPVRTVVDLGASAPWLVEKALERGIRQRMFTVLDVASFVRRVAKRGRSGVGVIRPYLEARIRFDGLTESELEDLFVRVWGGRQPQPIPQYEVFDRRLGFICRADFAFPRHRLRIELDSEAFHMDRPTFRKDRQVQNRTELLGWRTLRYTWWDLTVRPGLVVDEVLAALGKDGPYPLS